MRRVPLAGESRKSEVSGPSCRPFCTCGFIRRVTFNIWVWLSISSHSSVRLLGAIDAVQQYKCVQGRNIDKNRNICAAMNQGISWQIDVGP
jgi:hypothetical protein